VCQEVCPFNAAAADGAPELLPRPGSARPSLTRLIGLGAAQFRKWQRRSALRRVHRPQLLRNVAVALGNVGGVEELAALARALDESHPLIRMHVSWAIGQIAARTGRGQELLVEQRARERDPDVIAEIDAALAGR
jgi:epoxyqueuosine reductase QueG